VYPSQGNDKKLEILLMNVVDRPSKIVGTLIGEPSFADAMAAIDKAKELSPTQKRHWPTSLRQMGGYLDRPLSLIPTRIAAIGPAVKELHPARLGVNSKTFANHRANARAALLWFSRQTPDCGRKSPMDPCYRSLLEQVDDRYARDMLSPFFRFLSAESIQLSLVRNSHAEAYQAYRRDTSFGKVKRSQHRALVRHWNACAARIAGWPKIELTEPPYSSRFTGPTWQDFPQGLRDDIDAYCERITKRHKTVSGRIFRPCKQSTIDTRRRELIAAVRAAVAAGIPLEELKFLRDLLRPDRVEIIIKHYWQKNGEKPSLYTIDLASKLLALARSETLSEVDIEQLDAIRIALEQYRSTGLTEKNRRLIRQIAQSDVWREVVRLPRKLMAEARINAMTKPYRAAVTAQLAIAILILIRAPVRMQNLASICIGINLIRPGGPGAPYMLVFPDYDVKNGVPLEFAFDETTSGLIDEYIYEHRPHLMQGFNHDWLFAGAGQEHKGTKTLSEQISERLWKELGLKITPHQFRHAAAYIMLKADPGNYELVRRVLGHRSSATTRNFYIGFESLEATRLFGEMVTELERSGSPAKPRSTDENTHA
jgi:integrase